MVPREVLIGAVVVSVQLLYSAVYPFAEQTLKRIPQQVDEFWRGLSVQIPATSEIMSSLLQDEAVQSSAKQSGDAEVVDQEEQGSKTRQKDAQRHLSRREAIEQALTDRMIPHMSTIAQTLRDNGRVDNAFEEDLEISWDVHRITDAEVPWAYFFRVGVKNKSPRPCLFQGIARFYVLRAPDGKVFQIHRLTEGPAGFTLNAGQNYRYAWIFYTKYKTLEASGGFLLENRTQADGEEVHKRFFNTTLSSIQPAKAKGVDLETVQQLVASHHFMGVLDLRDATYI